MRNTRNITLALTILLCAMSATAVADINYLYAIDPDTTLTTRYVGAIVDNFDSGRPGWTYGYDYDGAGADFAFEGNGAIQLPPATGQSAAPYNNVLMLDPDPTNWYTVPVNVSSMPQSTMLYFNGATYNYLGLFWGSVDMYNTFEFFNAGSPVPVATFTGWDIALGNQANGNQVMPYSNLYVNFVNIPTFDAVRFTSTQYAFEFDNLAVGNDVVVPVPAAVLLGALGLGAAGLRLRKRA